ncbi:MAG: phage integrase SAM-like domain-containing protein [Bacteroidales bacterium]
MSEQEIVEDAFPLATNTTNLLPESTHAGTTSEKHNPTLSEVIEAYLDEGGWAQKTYEEYKASLNLLLRVIGDMPVNQVERPTIKEYKDTLRKLPPNIDKNKRYKNKSISDIIALGDKPISTKTVNKNLIRASTCFQWAVDNGYMDKNPATN